MGAELLSEPPPLKSAEVPLAFQYTVKPLYFAINFLFKTQINDSVAKYTDLTVSQQNLSGAHRECSGGRTGEQT